MSPVPPLPPTDPEPEAADEADDHGPPPSRVRASDVEDLSPARDLLDRYYADLSRRRPLTREGEVAIGRRIEAAERAIVEAWLASPRAIHEIALMADDVRAGAITLADLLAEQEIRDDPSGETREARLADLLAQICALDARGTGSAAPSPMRRCVPSRAVIVAGLVDLRIDATVGERIERCLREVLRAAPDEREAVSATLAEIGRARRAVARAKGELIEANLRLAVSVARQFRRPDVPLVDLAQEGNLGLIRAADRFDYRRGHRFSTYAVWWIKQAIRHAILRQGEGLRVPAHLAEARSRIFRVRRDFAAQHGRDATPEEVAARAGVSMERVRVVDELALQPLRLDAPVGEDGDTSLGDLMAGADPPADEILARRRMVEETHAMLEGLTDREREVIIRRFGLYDREDETLEEIGRSSSLTRERIRQVEAAALAKLRARSRRRRPAG